MELVVESAKLLQDSGFATEHILANGRDVLVFEDATVVGFLFQCDDVVSLLASWETHAMEIIRTYQFGLRRAAKKAWNVYMIFLVEEEAGSAQQAKLTAIEEDLSGTRKIARSGVQTSLDLREALLPLLPLQAAPRMEAVNILDEIRERATEVNPRVLEAFFSSSDEAATLHIFEEQP